MPSRRARLWGPPLRAALTLWFAALAPGCREGEHIDAEIEPGPNAQEALQRALIEARGGLVVSLGSGRFHFDASIVVDAPGVRLRGQGMNETILDFSGVSTGSGDGLLVTGDRFVLEDLAIEGPPGDAVRLQKVRDLAIRRVRIDWPGEPSPRNGGYGLYPIECRDLVIESNVIRGAADSGIYVGQSERAVVQHNRVSESVAGIQIENSSDVDVQDNELRDNAAGLLAFALPELSGATRRVRISRNSIASNNGPNFARPAARVAAIPPGTGVVLMAADQVEVVGNRIASNRTINLSIYSYAVMDAVFQDRGAQASPQFDSVPEDIWIHGNRFDGGGDAPGGALAEALRPLVGLPFPDIVFGGATDPGRKVEPLPSSPRFHIADNGDADFIDLDLERVLRGEQPRMSRDLTPYGGAPSSFAQPTRPQRQSER